MGHLRASRSCASAGSEPQNPHTSSLSFLPGTLLRLCTCVLPPHARSGRCLSSLNSQRIEHPHSWGPPPAWSFSPGPFPGSVGCVCTFSPVQRLPWGKAHSRNTVTTIPTRTPAPCTEFIEKGLYLSAPFHR